jgi:hypothetical protein
MLRKGFCFKINGNALVLQQILPQKRDYRNLSLRLEVIMRVGQWQVGEKFLRPRERCSFVGVTSERTSTFLSLEIAQLLASHKVSHETINDTVKIE